MTPKKAVLWDMDGTLIDSEPTALDALTRAIAEVGIPEGFSTWTAARRSPPGGGGPR